jgi:class 3 adenylate cyclase
VAERRVCSVLFCDVVGFTPLSESRDPEAVRELLSRYFEVARTVIGRYGGVVEKFIGDAVMAVWGTPVERLPPSRCPGCPPLSFWELAPIGLTSRPGAGGERPLLRASQPENHRYGEISLG